MHDSARLKPCIPIQGLMHDMFGLVTFVPPWLLSMVASQTFRNKEAILTTQIAVKLSSFKI